MPATATTTIKGPETKAPVITASAIGGYLIGLFGGMLTASPKVFMREHSQRDGTKGHGRHTGSAPAHCCSRKLQTDCERGRIALSRCRRSQHELLAAAPEYSVILVTSAAWAPCSIGRMSEHTIRECVLKIHLCGELEAPPGLRRRAHFEVNVHRAA